MRLKIYNVTIFFLAIIMSILSCDQKETNSDKLCKEFYQLNKDKNFEGLYDLSIGGSRVMSVYDKSSNQYDLFFKAVAVYDLKSRAYITIPVFKKAATFAEKDSTFKSFNQKTKGFLSDKLKVASDKELFEAYLNYTNMVLERYNDLETPKWYSAKNVIIEGNPSLGKFITFTLKTSKKVCKCYFVSDKSSLTGYWLKHFSKLNKLDNTSWYYEISDNK